jgi:hypothetical protein
MHATVHCITDAAAGGTHTAVTQISVTEAAVTAGVTLQEYFAWAEKSLTLAALDEALAPFYLLPRCVLCYYSAKVSVALSVYSAARRGALLSSSDSDALLLPCWLMIVLSC